MYFVSTISMDPDTAREDKTNHPGPSHTSEGTAGSISMGEPTMVTNG